MATAFSGNATAATGNANSLLTISNLYFAGNVTARANGARTAYFDNELRITASDPANLTIVAAANATDAANVPPGAGWRGVAGQTIVISPGWVISGVTAGNFANAVNYGRADAGNVFVATTNANQTLNISGF